MTRIDFYILSSGDTDSRLQVVCKLIDKATSRGQRVFVHSDEHDVLHLLDEALLHFRPERFIAHRLLTESTTLPEDTEDELEPVVLSTEAPTRTDAVFINLAREVPVFFSRFERTLEVIDQQESIRLDGRGRYRFYQERGYPLQHHNL